MVYSIGAELMDNPTLFELAEDELDMLIKKMHKSGLNYWVILGLFLDRSVLLRKQADAEYQVKLK